MHARSTTGRGRWAAVVVAVGLSCASVGVTGDAGAAQASLVRDKPIQPGAAICGVDDIVSQLTSAARCEIQGTLNFVFRDDDGALYVGTAAHNVTTDAEVFVPHCPDCRNGLEGSPFGDVVFSSDSVDIGHPTTDPPDEDLLDFALIKIRPTWYRHVEPAVRYWGGPVELTEGSETTVGDEVVAYGNGDDGPIDICATSPTGITSAPRPGPRGPGQLVASSRTAFSSTTCEIGGDSGMPYVHGPTGTALGVNANCVCGGTGNYPTLTHILERLADADLPVHLVTAPPSSALERVMAT